MAGETFNGIPMSEIDELFDKSHSNQEDPLIGRVYTPICYHCKNLVLPDDPFKNCTCKVFGNPPDKYRHDDKEMCPHKIEE